MQTRKPHRAVGAVELAACSSCTCFVLSVGKIQRPLLTHRANKGGKCFWGRRCLQGYLTDISSNNPLGRGEEPDPLSLHRERNRGLFLSRLVALGLSAWKEVPIHWGCSCMSLQIPMDELPGPGSRWAHRCSVNPIPVFPQVTELFPILSPHLLTFRINQCLLFFSSPQQRNSL